MSKKQFGHQSDILSILVFYISTSYHVHKFTLEFRLNPSKFYYRDSRCFLLKTKFSPPISIILKFDHSSINYIVFNIYIYIDIDIDIDIDTLISNNNEFRLFFGGLFHHSSIKSLHPNIQNSQDISPEKSFFSSPQFHPNPDSNP